MVPTTWLMWAAAVSFAVQAAGAPAPPPGAFTLRGEDSDGHSGLASRSWTPEAAGAIVTVQPGNAPPAAPAPAGKEVAAPKEPEARRQNVRPAERPPSALSQVARNAGESKTEESKKGKPKSVQPPVSAGRQTSARPGGSRTEIQAKPASPARTIVMTATAYGPGDSGEFGDVDAFGRPLRLGVVAVDPAVIPLGSKVRIQGLKAPGISPSGFYAVAADTGGAIKGNRIDVYLPLGRSQLLEFGIQRVTVEVMGR
ncbi:MAG: 3D domain-containing protein [Alicyclobacillaceae bacterium]|nr:3D domain-containing protein [Alicyclobacillaceae bacterium]